MCLLDFAHTVDIHTGTREGYRQILGLTWEGFASSHGSMHWARDICLCPQCVVTQAGLLGSLPIHLRSPAPFRFIPQHLFLCLSPV